MGLRADYAAAGQENTPACKTAEFHPQRDVYHRNPYLASQTLAQGVTENPAHNGSILWREANRSNRRNSLGPAEVLPTAAGHPEL